jgi:hypothetical protein
MSEGRRREARREKEETRGVRRERGQNEKKEGEEEKI